MYSKSILSNLHFFREVTERNLTTIDSIIALLESDLVLEDKFWKGNIGTCSKCLRDELKEHLETQYSLFKM